MTSPANHQRRQFLLGAGTLIASSALPLAATARDILDNTVLEGIVAYRESDVRSAAYAAVLAEAGMTLLPLAVDPVRQWRDQVRAALEAHSLPMHGLTDWADFQLMRELNSELQRWQVSETRHAAADRGDVAWAAGLAMQQIDLLQAKNVATDTLADGAAHNANLFSWTIS